MGTYISNSPAETEALGASWGRNARAGIVIALCGELGAGKTQLVKGIAAGLGIPGRVHSPSFTLVNIYGGGRLFLYHIDLYRLQTPEQIIAAGLDEYLQPHGVTAIEWAEKWFGNDPLEAAQRLNLRLRWVNIRITDTAQRCISYEDFGT
jgi:tRNA threonylcarbamoyladenosine biosynthesis protein TsaE